MESTAADLSDGDWQMIGKKFEGWSRAELGEWMQSWNGVIPKELVLLSMAHMSQSAIWDLHRVVCFRVGIRPHDHVRNKDGIMETDYSLCDIIYRDRNRMATIYLTDHGKESANMPSTLETVQPEADASEEKRPVTIITANPQWTNCDPSNPNAMTTFTDDPQRVPPVWDDAIESGGSTA
jgi:hypothetical protein